MLKLPNNHNRKLVALISDEMPLDFILIVKGWLLGL